ncbi:HNH endonuclease [Hazenella sp. IB182357]|uniref:HNH endonuclease n=1 Tax=Polycladospora coralii TaxID=2771432 RepID=A0A926RVK0_9BACL|nr:HNH endonuclease [Polycladospora coralii]
MIEENKKRNGGVVKSDDPNDYFDVLVQPRRSQRGITPPQNKWQIDHIIPKNRGGTNIFSNASVISRKLNREKWDR